MLGIVNDVSGNQALKLNLSADDLVPRVVERKPFRAVRLGDADELDAGRERSAGSASYSF